jgi:hypothetical protein
MKNKMQRAQRTLSPEHNDRSKPFHLEAGKIEYGGDVGNESCYRNYKVLDAYATLDELRREAARCAGYHFIDMLYADDAGLLWEIDLKPAMPKD